MPKIMNNIVTKDKLREIQSSTLQQISDILLNSFGPNGSNACIKKENALSRYSKDGHTIISALHYNGIIEQSIKDDVESITRHVVKTVGDGTTSAVILANLIFNNVTEMENEYSYKPAEIEKALNHVVDIFKKEILERATDMTIDDVYDIAMISTNGNDTIANVLKDIYKEFGNSVFIDVYPSTGGDIVIKDFDGMTLNTGYCDSCYVTNQKENTAEVDKPEVYFFEHPIDTKEIGVYLDSILYNNIINPVRLQNFESVIPTVIFAPKISQDMSSLMDSLTAIMANAPAANKYPICIITDYHEPEQLNDLAMMCGAKLIRKYIDPKIYEEDVKNGNAPTPDTIRNWAGSCDRVVAYSDKTKFINPSKIRNEDGEYSDLYKNMISFLETEISKATESGEDARTIGTLKRRLHSLKSNLVELYIGGITQADRDALRDLVEDAVLNLRSAAANGVGLGGNVLAAEVIHALCTDVEDFPFESGAENMLANAILNAYRSLVDILFEDIIGKYNLPGIDTKDIAPYIKEVDGEVILDGTVEETGDYKLTNTDFIDIIEKASDGLVYNLRTEEWSKNVKTSIMSDIVILDTVCKIIGIMATCNQFVLPTAMHNIYVD